MRQESADNVQQVACNRFVADGEVDETRIPFPAKDGKHMEPWEKRGPERRENSRAS